MNMGELSIFWYLLQLLSLKSWSFNYTYFCFPCLVRISPRYLRLFEVIVEGVVSKISFSVHLSFIWMRATEFSEQIFCPATSLFFLISYGSILVKFLLKLMYIISSANKYILISSFPNCIPMISLSCHIALTKISSIILNR